MPVIMRMIVRPSAQPCIRATKEYKCYECGGQGCLKGGRGMRERERDFLVVYNIKSNISIDEIEKLEYYL